MAHWVKIPELTKKHISKFWNNLMLTDDNECWEWLGYKDNCGYGRMSISQQFVSAHRVAYFIFNGVDPQELHVLHTCDNPGCCSKNHLFLGTQLENIADKCQKGRQAFLKGEKNGEAKLNDKEVSDIIGLYSTGNYTYKMLADKYKVTIHCIYMAVKGKSWKHLGVSHPSEISGIKNGKSHWNNKLSEEDVLKIRKLYVDRRGAKADLARQFKISPSLVGNIISRKWWKHV